LLSPGLAKRQRGARSPHNPNRHFNPDNLHLGTESRLAPVRKLGQVSSAASWSDKAAAVKGKKLQARATVKEQGHLRAVISAAPICAIQKK
jgi:hypothetical protein